MASTSGRRELYNIASCMDGWTHGKFSVENKKNADDIANDLDKRFALRRLILGERIPEFQTEAKKRLESLFYVPDSEPPDLFFA